MFAWARLWCWALVLAVLSACHANAPGAVERATMLTRKGQELEAIAVLREHLATHPEALEERQLLVRVLAITGDLGAAKREAEQLAKHAGADSPLPWIELGHAFELAHRYERALDMYDRAARIAPSDPAGPRVGGLRAARWGEVELAEPRLVEALRREPTNSTVWHALGVVRVHLGDLDGAALAYRSGLKADPRALENRIGLATIAVKSGDAAGALRQYEAVLAGRPKFADGYLGKSWALLELGRLDEAEAAIDTAVRLGADRDAARAQLEELWRRRRR